MRSFYFDIELPVKLKVNFLRARRRRTATNRDEPTAVKTCFYRQLVFHRLGNINPFIEVFIQVLLKMKILAAFVILLQVSQQASAVTLKVKEGAQSVLLPCNAPAGVTLPLAVDTVVEWKRLNPDITVHVRRDNRDQPNDQNQLYRSRTSLRADALDTGDLSLTLMNIQSVDQGTYNCSASQGRNTLFSNKVDLDVTSKKEAELISERDELISEREELISEREEFYNLYVTFLVLFICTLVGGVVSAAVVYKKYIMKG